ncbi:MAG: glycosyltransferase family 4 protein [Promethearchaeota archaeon]
MKVLLNFTYGVSLENWYNMGVISRETSLYNKLTEKKIKFSFLTFGNQKDLEFSNYLKKIKVYPVGDYVNSIIPKLHFIKSLLLPIKLKVLFKKVNIIKTNQIRGSWIACVAKILFRKKIIIRGGYEWLSRYKSFSRHKGFKSYLKFLTNYIWIFLNELIAYKLADGIILTDKEDISFIVKCFKLKRKYRKGKIIHYNNFVDENLFKPINSTKKDKKILYIGNLKNVKNLNNLIKALKSLEGYGLDIIGKGPIEGKLKNLVSNLKLNVNFLGIFPHEKLPEIINQYEIFILPSYYEGNPKVLLEAMSCGVACIGTNVHGIKSIIKHKENGYLCGFSSKSIKEAIINLDKNKNLREYIAKNARKFILEKCSLDSISNKEFLFYKKVLK